MAFNWNIALTDQAVNGDGTGPYTVVLQKNATTPASGGTTVYSNTNSLGTFNILEITKLAVLAAVNANAAQNQTDSLN